VIRILGIFEDTAQADFHRGLTLRCAERLGLSVELRSRLTAGCRFDYLAEHVSAAAGFTGVLVGVDAGARTVQQKRRALREGLVDRGITALPDRLLFCVAKPSVEAWLMADPEALPRVLERELGSVQALRERPGWPSAERTAKTRLRDWSTRLAGAVLLQGGVEYAEQVAAEIDGARLPQTRGAELRHLIIEELPAFLRDCDEAEPEQN
jgi:hypothetical protein